MKTVTLLVPLFAAVAVLCACDSKSTTSRPAPGPLGDHAPVAAPAPTLDGGELYRRSGCIACHGPTGDGGMLGPAITDLAQHWNRSDLADFFATPERFVKDSPRLNEQRAARTYAMPMPGVPHLSEAERLALADWSLAR